MHQDLGRAREIIERATAGMTPDEMSRHPEGKWSTAGILEHLEKAFSTSAQRLNRCVEDGAPYTKPDTWTQRFSTWLVVGVGYFPTGREAPEYVRPEGRPAEQSLAAFKAALEALDAACAAAEQRFGLDAKVANHPILGKFSVRQWRRFHLIHTRHHAKQIACLRRTGDAIPATPAPSRETVTEGLRRRPAP
ncbi:MAG: DinB family protein [Acidobacteriota bacterium]